MIKALVVAVAKSGTGRTQKLDHARRGNVVLSICMVPFDKRQHLVQQK